MNSEKWLNTNVSDKLKFKSQGKKFSEDVNLLNPPSR